MNITFVMCMCWLKYAYALMFVDDDLKSFGCVDRSCVEEYGALPLGLVRSCDHDVITYFTCGRGRQT